MEKGLMNYAIDFFWKQKASDGVTMGNIPVKGLDFRGEVLVPGNRAQQLKANKGVVYACVDLRATGVASTPLRVYKTKQNRAKSHWKHLRTRDLTDQRQDEIIAKAPLGSAVSRAEGIEEILNGPYVELLRNVNDYMNLVDLWRLTSTYEDLIGDCYWILVRNRLNMPTNIWVAPSEYMKPIADGNVFISGYVYKAGTASEIKFPKEDVVHFKNVTPNNQYLGMAPLVAVIDSFNLREYMFNFEKEMFRTGGNPKLVLFTKGSVTKPEADRIKESYKRTEEAGISVMYGEDFTPFQPEQITARDMGYREGIALTRDEIAAAYHVPKSMLTADDINLATATAQEHYLARYATLPSVMAKDQKMNEQLSPQMSPSGGDVSFVLFDDPVPENREEMRADLEMQIELGIITRAEARVLLRLDPMEGTDELLVPSNLVPLSMVGEQDVDEQADQVNLIMERARAKREAL